MKRRVLLLLSALAAQPILAQPKPASAPSGLEAAKIFALGPVGFAGKIPQELRLFSKRVGLPS